MLDRPENVYFADLMAEPLRLWAIAVGRNFLWQASRPGGPHAITECWIGADLALYARYSNPAGHFGARFAALHHDPVSGGLLDPALREHSSGSAAQQASNLLDGGLGGGQPANGEWTDDSGYRWWGDVPDVGWPAAVRGARMETLS